MRDRICTRGRQLCRGGGCMTSLRPSPATLPGPAGEAGCTGRRMQDPHAGEPSWDSDRSFGGGTTSFSSRGDFGAGSEGSSYGGQTGLSQVPLSRSEQVLVSMSRSVRMHLPLSHTSRQMAGMARM